MRLKNALSLWLLAVVMLLSVTGPVSAETTPQESLELLLSPEVIQDKIRQVAKQLNAEYAGKQVTLIMVMKGAVCVAADLMRELKVPVNLEYIKASSYGANGKNPGKLITFGLRKIDIEGKHILLVMIFSIQEKRFQHCRSVFRRENQ
ncbi:MAG TPA: phosphoribosyltransferase family protein [Chlamydiales bacterium]|nr:phosphoribosyltransferase family protein [Chlamydiales bacterium]